MKGRFAAIVAGCVFALAASWSHATETIKSKPLQFRKGTSSATIQAVLKGDETVDYKLRAKAGQTMSVTLLASNGATYFNVLAPDSKGEAIFIGSTSGDSWRGTLPADGEYAIRVYQMRSAARRQETPKYTLTVGVTGSGSTKTPVAGQAPMGDAKVKGTPYHATGKVRCSAGSEPAGAKECNFGVIRGAAGMAEVHVTYPGGLKRVLHFAGGKVTADDARSVNVTKSGDDWNVDINEYEHYRIPDAVVVGGFSSQQGTRADSLARRF